MGRLPPPRGDQRAGWAGGRAVARRRFWAATGPSRRSGRSCDARLPRLERAEGQVGQISWSTAVDPAGQTSVCCPPRRTGNNIRLHFATRRSLSGHFSPSATSRSWWIDSGPLTNWTHPKSSQSSPGRRFLDLVETTPTESRGIDARTSGSFPAILTHEDYWYLSATMGSTRMARRAGM